MGNIVVLDGQSGISLEQQSAHKPSFLNNSLSIPQLKVGSMLYEGMKPCRSKELKTVKQEVWLQLISLQPVYKETLKFVCIVLPA